MAFPVLALYTTGELQTFRHGGNDGSLVILHHANRVSDEYIGVGPWRVQVHGLHEDRHAFILHLSCARVRSDPSRVSLLTWWRELCCILRVSTALGSARVRSIGQ